ncbi:MAG: right-handed parallel beta-helix repeat-containing protein [Armatimonadetes bacterium]|nr:right-handed parallel beta-helix repeat-containing protein [Armatimonadota bacterium]MDW8122462.1 right-handed parallel beta-helix repeat-containing protein [Armatimonadota bacterium]
MGRSVSLIFLTVVMIVAGQDGAEGQRKGIILYVSPKGSDDWSGQRPVATRGRKDGPFATLQKALDVVAEIKKRRQNPLRSPIVIYVRGGVYYLKEPVRVGPEHSGTKESPLVIAAYRNERPVLSGGRLITGWEPVKSAGDRPPSWKPIRNTRLWRVYLPEVSEGKWFFRQLWVDGKRTQRARYPNKGYLKVKGLKDIPPDAPWHRGVTEFIADIQDIPQSSDLDRGEVVVMNRWVESRLPIKEVNRETGVLTFTLRSVFRLDPGDYFYYENIAGALDQPGEWYLDRTKGILYYLADANWNPNTAEVVAPFLSQVFVMDGKPEKGELVEHIRIEGLTFSHTEWVFPDGKGPVWPAEDAGGFAQAAVGVPGAVWGAGVRDCVFQNCVFTRMGTYGLELSRGCKRNKIRYCLFRDLGAGGIKIGEQGIREKDEERTEDNEISDCDIGYGGLLFHSAVGIWIGQSGNNKIVHNRIHNFYYTGISIGWTWGYEQSLAGGNRVEFNHVHHIGVREDGDGPILSDMGGIYTLGIQSGTVIRNNLWHDIAGYRYGGWGIYFDEGSSGILAENNLVIRTTHGGFHQHYGRENTVRNNIFAFARDHQIQASRPEPHLRFRFIGNIVYWKEGELLAGNFGDMNFEFDRNVYWREGGGAISFAGMTWEQWRQKGMDQRSVIADPLFVNPSAGNFRLRKNSPALALGFQPFDLSSVGPRKRIRRKGSP